MVEILVILILASISCSLLGVFLVLRKMSMMTDAISHTVFLGIVIAFIFVKDLSSPLLIIAATIMGLITVFLTEVLIKTKRVNEDAATGVIFPLLFSIAIIIVSKFFKNTHIDMDSVLLGNVELAWLDQLTIFGTDIGPKSMYILIGVLILILLFIGLMFKQLKISSFDPALSMVLGISPIIIGYLLMGLVSLTAVASFEAVGSILVVALMIGPAVTALLFTKSLFKTLIFAASIALINSIVGFLLAYLLNVNVSGMVASITLIVFILAFLFNPKKGMISTIIKKRRQKYDFALITFLTHIDNHNNDVNEVSDETIGKELNWKNSFLNRITKQGLKLGYIKNENNVFSLTKHGKKYFNKFKENMKVGG